MKATSTVLYTSVPELKRLLSLAERSFKNKTNAVTEDGREEAIFTGDGKPFVRIHIFKRDESDEP